MKKLSMVMKLRVRIINLMYKLLTCKSNLIIQLFNIKHDLIHVAKQFNFVDNEHCYIQWRK